MFNKNEEIIILDLKNNEFYNAKFLFSPPNENFIIVELNKDKKSVIKTLKNDDYLKTYFLKHKDKDLLIEAIKTEILAETNSKSQKSVELLKELNVINTYILNIEREIESIKNDLCIGSNVDISSRNLNLNSEVKNNLIEKTILLNKLKICATSYSSKIDSQYESIELLSNKLNELWVKI